MKFILIILLSLNTVIGYAEDIKNCSPKVLYYGDTFTIDLNTPHGSDFIITPPSRKKTFEICFWYPKDSKNKPETMFEYNECKNVKQVKLVAGITEVGGWNHEEESFGPFKSVLFQEVGTYEIIVSPNIETDDPVISKCLVEYKGKKWRLFTKLMHRTTPALVPRYMAAGYHYVMCRMSNAMDKN